MRCRVVLAGMIAAGTLLFAGHAAADTVPPNTTPTSMDMPGVPGRTSISLRVDFLNLQWGTANDTESRSGLSLVKLYMVDYALRHGDRSAQDRQLAERMIRYSDDSAADAIAAKYPNAIDAEAAEYGLPATHSGPTWGQSYTSTADITKFLDRKMTTDPGSPILGWMATASPVAADGTAQNWGTARLPGVIGNKWGWSDYGPPQVGSASYGPGFTISAQTDGGPGDQTADVLSGLAGAVLGAHPPVHGIGAGR
ncbi:hypothetical protein [Nocardia macrotermitis]|uniref:Serine hydrolase n=1 Tax=Nocardia macrotermitis TaxID=2585198 RepID=A0A7K0D6U0_9NOCA|nr:hypothetical protein [Nocardia macrotermitis]MQY20564.1 hypothetical protein [Nocardia macrotermitis]